MTVEERKRALPASRPDEGPKPVGLSALPRRVAVVVGGGAALEAAHVGVEYALEQRGFVPDLIVGTSAGALNGAIMAHPGRAAARLDHVWSRLRRREVFPLGSLSSRAGPLRRQWPAQADRTGRAAGTDRTAQD